VVEERTAAGVGASRDTIDTVVTQLLTRLKRPAVDLGEGTVLYEDGLGLDSLETAELSVMLEDEFGTDPFSDGTPPSTLGDIYAFYDA
jgi:acyl carrier protein